MKLSELIKKLEETLEKEGDLPVFVYIDRDDYPGLFVPFEHREMRKELAPGSDGQWSDAIVFE